MDCDKYSIEDENNLQISIPILHLIFVPLLIFTSLQWYSAPIMSRFDLFFVILDECNPTIDEAIAR